MRLSQTPKEYIKDWLYNLVCFVAGLAILIEVLHDTEKYNLILIGLGLSFGLFLLYSRGRSVWQEVRTSGFKPRTIVEISDKGLWLGPVSVNKVIPWSNVTKIEFGPQSLENMPPLLNVRLSRSPLNRVMMIFLSNPEKYLDGIYTPEYLLEEFSEREEAIVKELERWIGVDRH